MKLKTIKRNNKKKIIIGSMVVLSVVGCLTLTTTRAKYRSVQSLKLASGTVKYTTSDLQIVAIKISEDGGNYTDTTQVPTDGYTLSSKSSCSVNKEVDTNITITYDNGNITFSSLKKGAKCNLYFDKKLGQPFSTILATIKASSSYKGDSATPTFGTKAQGAEFEANNGIYRTLDPMYGSGKYTYYWRGNATTNHVIFDNKCWRIVRINGDGSIRLIYNGTPSGNTCTQGANSNAVIMGSSDAEKYYATSDGQYGNSSYVGWTYTLSSQWPRGSGTDSNAKYQTEKWYSNNISASAKAKVDPNGKFCNDRTVGQPLSTGSSGYVTTWSATGTRFAYAGVKRLWESYAPTLNCTDSRDIYTLRLA